MTASRSPKPPLTVSQADVEHEIKRLFGEPGAGLVIRVHGEDSTASGRNQAFRELLDSLAIYDFPSQSKEEIRVEPPDTRTLATALAVLGAPHVKRRLFERILLTFGKRIVDPLGQILDTTPGGTLLSHMANLRSNLLAWIAQLKLTQETQQILGGDLRELLSDEYLAMLAEHEEKVQRPRVTELAQHVLQLIGSTFERAFRHWPKHAQTIAESVSRRMGMHMTLRESPQVIRDRIVEGVEEFLWIETSTELTGAVQQLFQQPRYRGLVEGPPAIERVTYRKFAEACWDIISENC